jgi:hypothetical protein
VSEQQVQELGVVLGRPHVHVQPRQDLPEQAPRHWLPLDGVLVAVAAVGFVAVEKNQPLLLLLINQLPHGHRWLFWPHLHGTHLLPSVVQFSVDVEQATAVTGK